MEVSVIIPTYNRKELLTFGLQSLAKQKVPWPYEIIVLNEYYEDGTREICAPYPNVRYVMTRPTVPPDNLVWRVPGAAINIGAKLAQAKIIIISCPEIYLLEEDVLFNIVNPLLTTSKVMTYCIGFDDRNGNILDFIRRGLPFTLLPDKGRIPSDRKRGIYSLNTLYPFFMGINREKFISIGGYDEDFLGGYCFDDNDFMDRMELSGCTYLLVSGRILHLYHSRLNYKLPAIRTFYDKNLSLYKARMGIVNRNVGREWGIL